MLLGVLSSYLFVPTYGKLREVRINKCIAKHAKAHKYTENMR